MLLSLNRLITTITERILCMFRANPDILNNIGVLRHNLCVDVSNAYTYMNMSQNISACNTTIAQLCNKLFYLISENTRMNLSYLAELRIEYDAFDFVGIKRNIRNSVEALYDLYNLTIDNEYYNLLYYFHQKSINHDYCNDSEKNRLLKIYSNVDFNSTYLPLRDKAEIAKRKNGFCKETYRFYKNISNISSRYIHVDVFTPDTPPQLKESNLKNLLSSDCIMLASAYKQLLTLYPFYASQLRQCIDLELNRILCLITQFQCIVNYC